MYHNHIPHNRRPLEDLLNGKMQRGYSHHPQRAGLRWAGHDVQPETVVRILDSSRTFILTWTDLFQIGTPRELGLTTLLSNYIKPGKQYEYRMDFRFPDAVYLIEKGSPDALMVDLAGSIVHAPDTPKTIKAVNIIANYQTEYELFLWAGGIDAQANDATLVSPNALSTSRLRTLLTEDVSLTALLISQIRDYHKLQLRRHLSLAQPLRETSPPPRHPYRSLPAQQGPLERSPHGRPQRQRSLPRIEG